LPGAAIVDLAWEIRTLRMVKAPEELAILARAGAIMTQVPALVRAHFHPGITELALSAALEHAFRLNGHDALIRCRREGVEMSGCGVCATGVHSLAGTKFDGICGGTGLSPAVPYGAADAPIPQGAPILLDFAFVLAGYHLDQTRMACWGTPAEPVRAAYAAMLEVQAAIFAAMRPGAVWETIYQEAVAQAAALGYAEVFMGAGRERVKFVGHGVGLELDEPPFLAPQMPYPLAEGMALAIEPKVALPGVGVVGIEDTVVVRAAGVERLTPCSQEWIVVE
jgi:Xaa-Pro aminopeptidase